MIVVVVERKGRGGHGILLLCASSYEGGGAEKYLTSSGGLEKIFKEKTKIPIGPPTNKELVFVAKVFRF